jgi:hypothetical protein
MNTQTDIPALWERMQAAATAAAVAENGRLGPEAQRGFDCGFGWVVIRPARGKLVSFLKARGAGYSNRGWHLSANYLHGLSTQSVSVHRAAAEAAAEILAAEGFDAFAQSRLD